MAFFEEMNHERAHGRQAVGLGLQEVGDEKYESMRTVGNHTYVVPPVSATMNRAAATRFQQFAGSMTPTYERERFDRLREQMQVGDKKDKASLLEALGILYITYSARNFAKADDIDHAVIEKMFYPKYLPSYEEAMKALGLWEHKRKFWYKRTLFETLENISRLPLGRVGFEKKAALDFEEFYHLLWNHYMPFNAVSFYCHIVGQSMVYTREFVNELAQYLKLRIETCPPLAKDPTTPIVVISPLGKLGYFLNETKILPCPVVTTHHQPKTNPYLLKIPNNKQKEFKLHHVEKLKTETAMDKYKPGLVLMTDLPPNKDTTQEVRGAGCVKEYLTLGMPDSPVEGNPWQTWGLLKYRDLEDRSMAPFYADGFGRDEVKNVSRWMIYKTDSEYACHCATAMSYSRKSVSFDRATKFALLKCRMRPFW